MVTSVVKATIWQSWMMEDFPPSSIDTSWFTHIYYHAILLNDATFELVVSDSSSSLMSEFQTTLHQKNASIKTMLSIGIFNDDAIEEIFSRMASSPSNRMAFIKSTIDVARQYNFDGLDIRWIPKGSTGMANLGILLGEWRAAIDREVLVSGKSPLLLNATVYYTTEIKWGVNPPSSYPTASINQNLDWVNVKCFDYYGDWTPSKTGPHAALYATSPDNKSTQYGLGRWIGAGVSPKKLVMGFPLHGWSWKLQHPDSHGIGAPANGVGPGNTGYMTFSEVETFNRRNDAMVVHDEQTGSTYSYAETAWISYNDEMSAKLILNFAIEKKLLGYFFSMVHGDTADWKISRLASTIWDTHAKQIERARYLKLYKAALNGDWDFLGQSFRNHGSNDTIDSNVHLSMFSENVIHVIASKGHGTEFLRELINDPNLDQDVLLEKDADGNTALFLAAMSGNIGVAEILVDKNSALLTIPDSNGTFPVYVAAMYGHKETAEYLIGKTMERVDHNFDSPNGVYLLNLLITAGFYDMAKSLLKRFHTLSLGKDIKHTTPLQTLAKLPHDLWQRDEQGNLIQLMSIICKDVVKGAETTAISDHFWDPLLTATKLGIHEMVVEIIKAWPYIVWFTDGDEHERTIYHYAVMHRHEKLFNLIWNLGSNRYRIANMKGKDNNNILHLAAKLRVNTTSRVSGAALQMQRELQWYKEVEKLVQKSFQEEKGKDDMTPGEVFTKEHKALVKEGEEWMKTTASASTLVAVLIVTVAFAAAFTVPGGNDSTGVPIFLKKSSFIIFAISNAIAFFSSSTSLMMFLGILNSRYSEIDFLHSLPRKLIIGLFTLFLSILCMLIAFSASLHLYLVHLSKFVIIPIVLCPCIPATIFGFLQFPLLYEIAYSTYGPSIFRHEVLKVDYTRKAPIANQAHLPAPALARAGPLNV